MSIVFFVPHIGNVFGTYLTLNTLLIPRSLHQNYMYKRRVEFAKFVNRMLLEWFLNFATNCKQIMSQHVLDA